MKLYNTLTRTKEEFQPQSTTSTTLYVCGITPYDTTHLGHAFTYIAFDCLIRYLKYRGQTVIYTQNVTDINDRDSDILKRAKEQNTTWTSLSTYWTNRFLNDMTMLNWIKPTFYLKASRNIPSMLQLIDKLVQKNYAYVVNKNVYLDVKRVKEYGILSRLSESQMLKTAQEFEEDISNPDKRHPLDITLWRATVPNQPTHIPSFQSPYGKGRPGWHIECSAMATVSLGEQIDIHGGGIDLIYPHHESEIAQSQSATSKAPFAKFWVHTGPVYYQGKKMSKSLGNLVMVSNLLENYCPNSIRWLLASHHYRKQWEYTHVQLQESDKACHLVAKALAQPSSGNNLPIDETFRRQFEQYMNDDLQTPKVLDLFKKTAETILQMRDKKSSSRLIKTLSYYYKILGFSTKHTSD